MLSCTGKRSHRHTILHVSFSNSFGLASARPTPQGLSGAPFFPFPVSGEYYDFGFSRELGYLDGVTNPYLRRYILAIALFEILRYYVKEEMPKPLYDVWKGLIKNEHSFEERDMWQVILGNWPVQIDWNYYDLLFDGKNFAFIANKQSRLKELL